MKKTLLIALFSPALLMGCASFNYTDAPSSMGVMYSKYADVGYSGDIRPFDEIGIVTTDGLIKVRGIDGQPLSSYQTFKSSGFYSGGRYQLHLLPGDHELTLGFSDDRGGGYRSWSTSNLTKKIHIEKGQVIHLSLNNSGRTWTANESDGKAALNIIKADFETLSKK